MITFGSKSQKGRKNNRKRDDDDKEGDSSNFDGTEASISNSKAADPVPQEDIKVKRSENYMLHLNMLKNRAQTVGLISS